MAVVVAEAKLAAAAGLGSSIAPSALSCELILLLRPSMRAYLCHQALCWGLHIVPVGPSIAVCVRIGPLRSC